MTPKEALREIVRIDKDEQRPDFMTGDPYKWGYCDALKRVALLAAAGLAEKT